MSLAHCYLTSTVRSLLVYDGNRKDAPTMSDISVIDTHTRRPVGVSSVDEPRPRRLLVVGAGQRATGVLLPALRRAALPLTVAAVCDPDPAARHRINGLVPDGAPVFTDLDRALAAAPYDVAMLACPHAEHHRLALLLSDAGMAVWKEKPYALRLDEAVQLATRTSPGIRVLAHRPHSQLFTTASLRLPSWGRLLSYRIRITRQTSDYSRTWRADAGHAGGGAICDLGYHTFDLIARLTGQPATVYAVTAESPTHRPRVEVEESAHLTVIHTDGCAGTVYVSRCDEWAEEVDLVAEHGRITITGDRATIAVTEPGGLTHRVELSADDDPWAAMLRYHLSTLDTAVITAAEARIGVRATALMEAAYASLRLGRPAPVSALPDLQQTLDPEGLVS